MLFESSHIRHALLWTIAAGLLLAATAPAIATQGQSLTTREVSEKASAESKAQQVIEPHADGTMRMTAPMQDMEAIVGPNGVRVRSVDDAGSSAFGWKLVEMGRESALSPVQGAGRVEREGDNVLMVHANIVESFSSNADGIQQVFSIPRKPEDDGTLKLELAADGALLEALADASAISLRMSDGRILHYRVPHAADANGKELVVRMRAWDEQHLRIEVEDSGASYPVRIESGFSDADWLSLAVSDIEDYVAVSVLAGDVLYVGGRISSTPSGATTGIARWDGSAWSVLGEGVNGDVLALAWDGVSDRLFVGGRFDYAGSIAVNNIAIWNGDSWAAPGSGVDGGVISLAWDSDEGRLFVGGGFTEAGGVAASNVAMWDGQEWFSLGDGLNNGVLALAWDKSNARLFAGGNFYAALDSNLPDHIAVWDGEAWTSVGYGSRTKVNALVWDDENQRLYASGDFGPPGKGWEIRAIGMWDGKEWAALGSGFHTGDVRALAWDIDNERLFIGGDFRRAGDASNSGFAIWDGSELTLIGNDQISTGIYTLTWDAKHGRLFAGGSMVINDAHVGERLVTWDGEHWSGTRDGMNGSVVALAWDAANARLFAGGHFSHIGSLRVNKVAMWNGSEWSALGAGISDTLSSVFALVWDAGNARLFAGGNFVTAGDSSANNVAVWSNGGWSALGDGRNFGVWALAWDSANQRLFAAGQAFPGQYEKNVAIWDGAAWLDIGISDGWVRALAWDSENDRLFAGGQIGGGIKAWNGHEWVALGSGVNGFVYSLAWDADEKRLFAGGSFNMAGGNPAKHIAMWDGVVWAALGGGMEENDSSGYGAGGVYALAWDSTNRRLFAGGAFTTADNEPTNNIAAWNGFDWSPLGSGTNRRVQALIWDGFHGRLFVGGEFSSAGGHPARIAAASIGPSLYIQADSFE